MEVDVASNGTALLDYQGNARPAWHAFRFWGDLPIERAVRTPGPAAGQRCLLNSAPEHAQRKVVDACRPMPGGGGGVLITRIPVLWGDPAHGARGAHPCLLASTAEGPMQGPGSQGIA